MDNVPNVKGKQRIDKSKMLGSVFKVKRHAEN